MGTMGPGVFDNDAALDALDATVRVPLADIEGFLDSNQLYPEHIDGVAACIAIHTALVRECGAAPPARAFAEEVCGKLLRLFDSDYDKLKPEPGFKPRRRAVLVDTLDRYQALAT